MKQSWHAQKTMVYRDPIANISSAPWSNAEKCESRGGGFIHQKSDEWNIYASNWNRLTLQNNFPEGGSKSFYD